MGDPERGVDAFSKALPLVSGRSQHQPARSDRGARLASLQRSGGRIRAGLNVACAFISESLAIRL